MDQSALFLFLGKCLAMDESPDAEAMVRQQLPAVPMKELLEVAITHSLLSALWPVFSRHHLISLLPAGIDLLLEKANMLNREKNRRIMKQVADIALAFRNGGLHPVFLKGAGYLLQGLYPDLGERIMTDIDVLVKEEEEESSVRLLRALGYDHLGNTLEGDYDEHRHLPPFVHPGGEVPVELHRMPLHGDYAALLPVGEAHGHSQEAGMNGARVLSVQHQQVLHVFHERHHTRGKLDSLGTLRGMYDFHLLSRMRHPAPEDVSHKRSRRKFERYIATVNQVLGLLPKTEAAAYLGYAMFRFPGNYLGRQLFLMNHPWLNRLYFQGVYRPLYLAGLTLRSPFQSAYRRLLAKKWNKFLSKTPLSGLSSSLRR